MTVRRPYAPRMPAARRREQVLDAALDLIVERGWRGLSMEAVAQRIGVTRPVVYRAYGSLPVLLGALLVRERRRAERLLDRVVPADPGDREPEQVLQDGLAGFLASVQEHPRTWQLVLAPVEGTPAAVSRHVVRRRAALTERLARLLDWGLPRLDAPADLDRELLARMLLSAVEEAGRLVLTEPERGPPERFERFAVFLLAHVRFGEVPR